MPFLPWFTLAGQPRRPQFLLKDFTGRAYGVVEHYETGADAPGNRMLLEFHPVDGGPHPWVGWDLTRWTVLEAFSRELPDAGFVQGLSHFLGSWEEAERHIKRSRALRAKFWDAVRLAEQGYTVAFAELFPREASEAEPQRVRIAGQSYRVDDQYGIQPGDFREEVTLALIPEDGGGRPVPGAEPDVLANWKFGEGCDILQSAVDAELAFASLREWMSRSEAGEKRLRERLTVMRRQGVLLQVAPKPMPLADA